MLTLDWCKSLVGLPSNFVESVPELKILDLGCCENLTCLWENDANIKVKELFFANGLVTHKIDLHLLLTNPTWYTSLNSVIIIDSKLLCDNEVPHPEITHARLS